jgi:hypothetical protein
LIGKREGIQVRKILEGNASKFLFFLFPFTPPLKKRKDFV